MAITPLFLTHFKAFVKQFHLTGATTYWGTDKTHEEICVHINDIEDIITSQGEYFTDDQIKTYMNDFSISHCDKNSRLLPCWAACKKEYDKQMGMTGVIGKLHIMVTDKNSSEQLIESLRKTVTKMSETYAFTVKTLTNDNESLKKQRDELLAEVIKQTTQIKSLEEEVTRQAHLNSLHVDIAIAFQKATKLTADLQSIYAMSAPLNQVETSIAVQLVDNSEPKIAIGSSSELPKPEPKIATGGSSELPKPKPKIATGGSSELPKPKPKIATGGSSELPKPEPKVTINGAGFKKTETLPQQKAEIPQPYVANGDSSKSKKPETMPHEIPHNSGIVDTRTSSKPPPPPPPAISTFFQTEKRTSETQTSLAEDIASVKLKKVPKIDKPPTLEQQIEQQILKRCIASNPDFTYKPK